MTLNDCLATPDATFMIRKGQLISINKLTQTESVISNLPNGRCRFDSTSLPNVYSIKRGTAPIGFIDSLGVVSKSISAATPSNKAICRLYNSNEDDVQIEIDKDSLASALINAYPSQTPAELSFVENKFNREFLRVLKFSSATIPAEMPLEVFDLSNSTKKISLQEGDDSDDEFDDFSDVDELENLEIESDDDQLEDADLYRLQFITVKNQPLARASNRLKKATKSRFDMTHEEVLDALRDTTVPQTTSNHYLHRNAKAKLVQIWEQRCPFLSKFLLYHSPLLIHGLGSKELIIRKLASSFSALTNSHTIFWTDPSLAPFSTIANNMGAILGIKVELKPSQSPEQICAEIMSWNVDLDPSRTPRICLCIPFLSPRFLSNLSIRHIMGLPWLRIIAGNDFADPQLNLSSFYHVHFNTFEKFPSDLISQVSSKVAMSKSHIKMISPLIIETVLRAVPLKTRLVFKTILEFHLDTSGDFKGLSRQQLATVCIQKLYSSNKNTMNHQLIEFIDHKIISINSDIVLLNFTGSVAALLVDLESKRIFE